MQCDARVLSKIVQAKEDAENGVDFSPRLGARCPWCGERARIYRTMPWEDTVRIRYHRCETAGCVLAALGTTIKSIQEDTDA